MCVFMFSLVTMEKIRIDGFHGDYLKISFFEGPDIAAGFTECSWCHWGFLYGRAKSWSERLWIQPNLPPVLETPEWG